MVKGKSDLNNLLMLIRSFQGVFWKEDVNGYLNLDLFLAFDNFVYVWECIKVYKKNTILSNSKVQGLLWSSLTRELSHICVLV